MRVYQIAREIGRPHRAVLQLLRELGYQIPSHMARLEEDEEQNLREAIDRQHRGAASVRAVHNSAPGIDGEAVAEVVNEVDLEEEVYEEEVYEEYAEQPAEPQTTEAVASETAAPAAETAPPAGADTAAPVADAAETAAPGSPAPEATAPATAAVAPAAGAPAATAPRPAGPRTTQFRTPQQGVVRVLPGYGPQAPGQPGTGAARPAPGAPAARAPQSPQSRPLPRPGQPGYVRPGQPGAARPGQPGVARPGQPGVRPGTPQTAAQKAAAEAAARKKKTAPGTKKQGRDLEVALEDIEREAEREQIEMIDEVVGAVIGPPLPTKTQMEPGQLIRTVDLSQVEDAEAPPPPQQRRKAVVNVGSRQIRTLQRKHKRGPQVAAQEGQTLSVQTPISLKEYSQIIGIAAPKMVHKLITDTGQLTWNMNSLLDEEKVKLLATAFARTVVVNQEQTAEEAFEASAMEEELAAGGEQSIRPPVVTILGHVDHGKTSLLDKIRDTKVAAGEHGGITQHIGAFQVETDSGAKVTFLDTPGHAAFTSMRARGAQAADIVVLVVDAADGVMPQTEEAINHAKVAGVPIVVALNKIDKPTANPTRVQQQLAAHGLQAEEWGGDTIMVKVSALRGDGIPELLEMLALQAEVSELRANPTAPPRGRVIEGRKDPARGVIATLLVEEGTLRRGDTIVAGMAMGRVRTMLDDNGKTMKEAGPSMPVEVFGLDDVPEAGEAFKVVEDEKLARDAVDERRQKERAATVVQREMPSIEKLFQQAGMAAASSRKDGKGIQAGPTEISVILKCDVRGSLEPIKNELEKLQHAEVKLNLLYAGLGAVTMSDVDNAISSEAVILGFHVLTETEARKAAERAGVEIRHYMVIYELIDDIRAAMERKLAPEKKEATTGHAQVRAVFQSSKVGTIAGSYILDGVAHRTDYVRVYRDGRLIYGQEKQIPIDSIKRFKDDVREVREGFECGIRIATYQDVKVGDVLEFYEMKEIQRKLT